MKTKILKLSKHNNEILINNLVGLDFIKKSKRINHYNQIILEVDENIGSEVKEISILCFKNGYSLITRNQKSIKTQSTWVKTQKEIYGFITNAIIRRKAFVYNTKQISYLKFCKANEITSFVKDNIEVIVEFDYAFDWKNKYSNLNSVKATKEYVAIFKDNQLVFKDETEYPNSNIQKAIDFIENL